MRKIILLMALMLTSCGEPDVTETQEYQTGYDYGYNEGYDEGHTEGVAQGIETGKEEVCDEVESRLNYGAASAVGC